LWLWDRALASLGLDDGTKAPLVSHEHRAVSLAQDRLSVTMAHTGVVMTGGAGPRSLPDQFAFGFPFRRDDAESCRGAQRLLASLGVLRRDHHAFGCGTCTNRSPTYLLSFRRSRRLVHYNLALSFAFEGAHHAAIYRSCVVCTPAGSPFQ